MELLSPSSFAHLYGRLSKRDIRILFGLIHSLQSKIEYSILNNVNMFYDEEYNGNNLDIRVRLCNISIDSTDYKYIDTEFIDLKSLLIKIETGCKKIYYPAFSDVSIEYVNGRKKYILFTIPKANVEVIFNNTNYITVDDSILKCASAYAPRLYLYFKDCKNDVSIGYEELRRLLGLDILIDGKWTKVKYLEAHSFNQCVLSRCSYQFSKLDGFSQYEYSFTNKEEYLERFVKFDFVSQQKETKTNEVISTNKILEPVYIKDFKQQARDPRWQKKRLEILERDKWTCQACGNGLEDGVPLNVHHVTYIDGKDYWDYPCNLLITLCENCHRKRHRK